MRNGVEWMVRDRIHMTPCEAGWLKLTAKNRLDVPRHLNTDSGDTSGRDRECPSINIDGPLFLSRAEHGKVTSSVK